MQLLLALIIIVSLVSVSAEQGDQDERPKLKETFIMSESETNVNQKKSWAEVQKINKVPVVEKPNVLDTNTGSPSPDEDQQDRGLLGDIAKGALTGAIQGGISGASEGGLKGGLKGGLTGAINGAISTITGSNQQDVDDQDDDDDNDDVTTVKKPKNNKKSDGVSNAPKSDKKEKKNKKDSDKTSKEKDAEKKKKKKDADKKKKKDSDKAKNEKKKDSKKKEKSIKNKNEEDDPKDLNSFFLQDDDLQQIDGTTPVDISDDSEDSEESNQQVEKSNWDWTQPQPKFRWAYFNGNMVAVGCDFPTHDAYKTKTTSDKASCGSICTHDLMCTHFSYASGKCKYFAGKSKRDDADWSDDEDHGYCGLSGVKKWNTEKYAITQKGCNFHGLSKTRVALRAGADCGKVCDEAFPRCTHFVANKDSCILKRGKPTKTDGFVEALTSDNSSKCGILIKACDSC